LGREGNLGAIVVGAEPYLTDLDVPGDPDFDDDIPFHIEAFYKYQVTDNISITPGVIWLTAPNQNDDNDDVVIGALRTTFSF
jgi:carbohydrate-selective porin OprB